MSFSKELKKARLSMYLTQKRLAEKTGIPLTNIKNWECGYYLPSAESWEKLYNYFVTKIPFSNVKNEYLLEKTQRGKKHE